MTYNPGWTAGAGTALAAFYAQVASATEISVTGATTATINRMHAVAMTSAAATITLPAASGNAGNVVGFHVLPTNTKCVTIDGNASETIDGDLTVELHKDATLFLYCTGTAWQSLVRILAPDVYLGASSDAGQAAGAGDDLVFEDIVGDSHGAFDGTTYTVPVAGPYLVTCCTDGTTSSTMFVTLDGTEVASSNGLSPIPTGWAANVLSHVVGCVAGSLLRIKTDSAKTRSTSPATNYLSITRLGD